MMACMKHFPCVHCNADDSTIVGAHGDSSLLGKGSRIKSHDIVAALCYKCHADYGSGDWGDDSLPTFLFCVYKTMVFGFNNGYFQVTDK
jgi:hypothetical protein